MATYNKRLKHINKHGGTLITTKKKQTKKRTPIKRNNKRKLNKQTQIQTNKNK